MGGYFVNSNKPDTSELKIGTVVYDKYGLSGKIKAIEGTKDASRITVRYITDSDIPKWSTYSITDIGTNVFLSAEDSANYIRIIKETNLNRKSKDRLTRTSLLNSKIEISDKRQVEQSSMKSIEDFLNSRNITDLLHFTSLDNLSTILQHGLLSVTAQETMGLKSIRSDPDNQLTDFISLSISFPNYLMLCNKLHHLDINWVMLTISPDILVKKYNDVLYCPHNATKYLKYIFNYQVPLKGVAGIQQLFSDRIITKVGEKTRADLALSDNLTSNPQAEVLIKERISIGYITGISSPNSDVIKNVEMLLKSRNLSINISNSPEYFSYRHDYSYWK